MGPCNHDVDSRFVNVDMSRSDGRDKQPIMAPVIASLIRRRASLRALMREFSNAVADRTTQYDDASVGPRVNSAPQRRSAEMGAIQGQDSVDHDTNQSKAQPARPVDLLILWMQAAAQAVGGGGTGQLYAYNVMVVSRRWISPETWAECWGICQIVPGVNIIAMALLTGVRLGGLWGAGASFAGLVVPGIVATVLITGLYNRLQGTQLVHSGLHGLMAAAAAASIVMSWRLAAPVMRASAVHGRWVIAVAMLIVVSSAILIRATQAPVFVLLLAGGGAMAITMWLAESPKPEGR
jgi:chromate transporter